MSILFFDGFDRCTVTKDWDSKYWSFEPQQPVEYKKYAFGGYSYNQNLSDYNNNNTSYYTYYSANNAVLPTGIFVSDIRDSRIENISGNHFPGFGSPPGFLALSNLDITNENLLAPITYIQLSGFPAPSGGVSFLTTRFLGIETKDSNYHLSDRPGRFGAKHPLVAFCSGNTTGLIINVIKFTGNHLDLIENTKMTIGLEIQQNNVTKGIFDVNVNQDIARYKVRSVYDNSVTNYRLSDVSGRILTIDTDSYETDIFTANWSSPVSRWCHFQFGIFNTGTTPYIQIKLEDIDLLSIPSDDTISDKDLWDDIVSIDSFDYDNIRFFNRTYNSSFQFRDTYFSINQFISDPIRLNSRYYLRGAVTLIDDVILSDAAGSTPTFLGKNAKVVPFSPGKNQNLSNSGNVPDGLSQWSNNTLSNRVSLKNADGDDGFLSADQSGLITAVAYTPLLSQLNYLDAGSVQTWGLVEDAIGGLKLYTQAKKSFLDTSYGLVVRTGIADPLSLFNKAVFNFENDVDSITDVTTNRFVFSKSDPNIELSDTVYKHGNKSLRLLSGEYIQNNNLSRDYNFELNLPNFGPFGVWDYVDAAYATTFTLDTWIKFSGTEDQLVLYSKNLANSSMQNINYLRSFDLLATTGYIQYNVLYAPSISNISYTGYLNLYFPSLITDNDWHHIALVNTSDRLVVYLDGISGVAYHYWQSGTYYWDADPFMSNPATNGPWSGTINNLYYWSNTDDSQLKAFTAFKGPYQAWQVTSRIPTRIHGNGYIDDYRITLSARYSGNFFPPDSLYLSQEDYIQIGDNQNLTKTRYGKILQFYQYNSPIDNQPWTTGLINHPSGLILGVKKL